MSNDKRQRARELWEQSGGARAIKDIAAELGVSESTVRSWKARDGWGGVATSRPAETQRATQRRRRASVNRKAAEAIEANDELKDREKEFCAAFLYQPNPTQAALSTGRYKSYGAAKTAGWEMMQKPAVIAEIKRLKAIKHQMLLADVDDLVELHMRIAFADISQFVEFGREEIPVMAMYGPVEVEDPDTGEKVPLMKEVNSVRFRESSEVDGQLIAEVKQGRDGASVKLRDDKASMKFLAQFFEANPMDKHKQEYDRRRLELEERKSTEGNEDALQRLDDIMNGVNAGMGNGGD